MNLFESPNKFIIRLNNIECSKYVCVHVFTENYYLITLNYNNVIKTDYHTLVNYTSYLHHNFENLNKFFEQTFWKHLKLIFPNMKMKQEN